MSEGVLRLIGLRPLSADRRLASVFTAASPVGLPLAETTPEAYVPSYEYVFDPAKDGINRAKHGVSLALAEVLLAGS
jgi:hypothetical protein